MLRGKSKSEAEEMAKDNILVQGAPDDLFNSPTHPSLQEFLSKVL